MKRLTFTALLCILLSNVNLAQTSNATLGGTVADSTGAMVPGVTVTARNAGTGIVNEAVTNEAGAYQFVNLQTGTYEVTAELSGFRTQRYTDMILGIAQQVRLNFTLQLADLATTVDVTATTDTVLATTTASIATVLPDFQVRELPLGDRNVLDLLAGMAGTGATEGDLEGYFAGNRLSAVNITRDGMGVGTGRYDQGVLGAVYMSPDLVEEVRVTTGTVDAAATRGSGQVQMVTRSGTNEFRGSAFWTNRNSALDAANWFNNFHGAEANWENRNQYGVRLGGPIIRNKSFFFFLIDNQRTAIREDFVGTVYTNEARQGIFRFFPGADSRNALQLNPTVDLRGNPMRPANATGDLRSINLFTYDPLRPGYDPSGYIPGVLLTRMPPPNDWTVGDGLNTAGIRFVRRIYGWDTNIQDTVDRNNRDQINVRIDHYFNPANKFSFIYTWEDSKNRATTAGIENWPDGFQGANHKYPRVYNFALVSTLSSSLVNEFRAGYRLHDVRQWAPWYNGRDQDDNNTINAEGQRAFALLPQFNGIPYQVVPQTFTQGFMNFAAGFGSTRGSWSPLLSFGDTLSWIHGRHSFTFGGEIRRDRSHGWNDNNFTPFVQLGPGNHIAPIDTITVPGLTSTNATLARNTLYNLAGAIDHVRQGFDLTSPDPPLRFLGYPDGVGLKRRDWRATEVSLFLKDDWKVSSNLTLNVGLKWEWFGVPYEARGLAGRVTGGYQGVCGYSECGLVTVELVGKNSPQPEQKLFNDDWNNFGPNVGFSFSLPGFTRSTVLRGGYGVSYSGRQIIQVMGAGGLDAGGGTLPGLAGITGGNGLTYRQTAYWSLANLTLPFEPQFEPLRPVPITDPRALNMNMYEPDRRVPDVQNFNFSIQRELANNYVLDVSYVGSKGTKLYGRLPLNVAGIYDTGFLEAFNSTRAGGDHPLFDQMLMGMNIPGVGVVNGTTITGSSALRRYTATRADVANGNVGAVANFLMTSTNITGQGGGFIRNSGRFPEDFLVPYPQFNEMGLNGNPANSTYHSMQVQLTKRLSHGFTNQTSYTWSKNLGLSDTEGNLFARDPSNRNLDKSVLGFHRGHIITSNGTYALPFGANRMFLSGGPGWIQQLAGQWQVGGIFRWSSGAPLSLSAGGMTTIWQNAAGQTPHAVGEVPTGQLTRRNGLLPTYFAGLTQDADPGRSAVTPVNTLNVAYNRRAIFDAQGNAVLVNPQPGQVGSLGPATIEGPSRFQLDMNLQKRVRVDERRELEFRADVVNILNHPTFGNPDTDINSGDFGLISSAFNGRRFTLGARLNF